MKNLEQLFDVYGFEALGFEQALFKVAKHFSPDYTGGMWYSCNIEGDDGFYLLLDDTNTFRLTSSEGNTMVVDDKTFSLAIFAYTANIYGWQIYGKNPSSKFASELFGLYHFTMRNASKVLNNKQLKSFRLFLD